jgi:hypothetical protein
MSPDARALGISTEELSSPAVSIATIEDRQTDQGIKMKKKEEETNLISPYLTFMFNFFHV